MALYREIIGNSIAAYHWSERVAQMPPALSLARDGGGLGRNLWDTRLIPFFRVTFLNALRNSFNYMCDVSMQMLIFKDNILNVVLWCVVASAFIPGLDKPELPDRAVAGLPDTFLWKMFLYSHLYRFIKFLSKPRHFMLLRW